MEKRNDLITMMGKPLIIEGKLPNIGDKAPDCRLSNQNLEDVKLSSLQKPGKMILLVSVPSLDTSVCSKEAHHFNQEASQFDKLQVIVISRDLPFAQKRWCGQEGIANIMTLSDYHYREFGKNYGLNIKEIGLLARAVFLVDSKGVIQYSQIVKEVTNEPDYKEVNRQIQQHLLAKK